MYIQALIWFFTSLLIVTQVNAEPISLAIAAFASTTIGSIVVNAAVGIALSVGSSLLMSLFSKKTTQKDPGTTVQLRVGGANPLMFPLGPTATAGVRVYYGVWTVPGATPNEYMVDVLALSMMPLPGATIKLWMNDQPVTIDYSIPGDRGYPILEYRKNGDDYAWVNFHDGTQTGPNAYLIDKFGSHPNYPWTSDMIGRGVAYITLTCRYDKDGLWQSGYPSVLVEIPSIPLYDPRKDSTVGGNGSHRWGQPSTYEPSSNNMVRAYNLARGVYFGDQWVYGGQNWPAYRLPTSSWFAAMNACDLPVDGEPQFHGGGMVECDIEIATAIEELLRSSLGLIAEIGGAYKVRVGAPGAPVMGFTDDNIVVTREQGYTPFPGLQDTYNIARITYTEPVERWSIKESPERRDEAAIISDDGRELPFAIDLPWVLSNTTAQRIGKTSLENGRRFRRHSMYYPPEFWLLEPLDTVAWTSAHNQYVNKEFEIEQISGNSAMVQGAVIRENDPNDYNWNPLVDKYAFELIPVVAIDVPVQYVTGWQVFPAIIYDNDGRQRRPSIEVRFDGNLTDIDRVHIQVKLADGGIFWDGTVPYPTPHVPTASVILNGDFPPNVACEVRGRFVPFTDRNTEWTEWLSVVTPDVKLIAGVDFDPYEGVVGFDRLADDVAGYQEWVGQGIRDIEQRFEQIDLQLVNLEYGTQADRRNIEEAITATYGKAKATWTREINVVAGETVAISQRVETLTSDLETLDGTVIGNAEAVDALQTIVETHGNDITATSNALTTLTSAVTDNTSQISGHSTAISGLQSTTSSQGGQISTLSSQMTSLNSTVSTHTGQIAGQASAISGLQTNVSTVDGKVNAQAQAITQLSAATDPNLTTTANFRMQVVTGPSGYSRIGGQGRVGGSGSWRSAGWYVDVPNSTSQPTRFVVQADQFVVTSSASAAGVNPLVWQGGVLHLTGARIGWAQIDNVDINWAQIQNAVVNNFVATNANIANLSVDTLKIQGNAISNSASSSAPSRNLVIPNQWYTIVDVWIVVPSDAQIVQFWFSCAGGDAIDVRILLDGTTPVVAASGVNLSSPGPGMSSQMTLAWVTPSGNNTGRNFVLQCKRPSEGVLEPVNNPILLARVNRR